MKERIESLIDLYNELRGIQISNTGEDICIPSTLLDAMLKSVERHISLLETIKKVTELWQK